MEAQPDFRELLALFNNRGVSFLVVGAYALAFHGVPRSTGDLDLLVQATPDNAGRILQALEEFGFGELGLTEEDFKRPEHVVQLGVSPVRVDLITSLTGVSWEDADRGKVEGRFADLTVFYLGKQEFIENKRALGRYRDKADLEALGVDPDGEGA